MRNIIIIMLSSILLHAGWTATSQTVKLSPLTFGGGAKVNIGFWNLTTNRWIGNPNALNRCDRVVFNFDLSSYIEAGKLTRAVLVLPLQPFGKSEDNQLELQVFTAEHNPIKAMDLIAKDVKPLKKIAVKSLSKTPVRVDVTTVVNKALARGDGGIAFRIRNITTEKLGNRTNKPEGAAVQRAHLKLEIIK